MTSGREVLLDTHVVIWMATDPKRLPAPLLQAVKMAKTRFVSGVSAWEIQIKHEKHGPPRFAFSLEDLEQTMKSFSCTELPISYEDIRALNELRFHHADPFDRLLISQASRRQLYLATLDQDIIATFEREKSFSLFSDRAHDV